MTFPDHVVQAAMRLAGKALKCVRRGEHAVVVWDDEPTMQAVAASREVIADMVQKTVMQVTPVAAADARRAIADLRAMPACKTPIVLWIGNRVECIAYGPNGGLS